MVHGGTHNFEADFGRAKPRSQALEEELRLAHDSLQLVRGPCDQRTLTYSIYQLLINEMMLMKMDNFPEIAGSQAGQTALPTETQAVQRLYEFQSPEKRRKRKQKEHGKDAGHFFFSKMSPKTSKNHNHILSTTMFSTCCLFSPHSTHVDLACIEAEVAHTEATGSRSDAVKAGATAVGMAVSSGAVATCCEAGLLKSKETLSKAQEAEETTKPHIETTRLTDNARL